MNIGNLPHSEGTKYQVTSASANSDFFFIPPLLPLEPTQEVAVAAYWESDVEKIWNKVGEWRSGHTLFLSCDGYFYVPTWLD